MKNKNLGLWLCLTIAFLGAVSWLAWRTGGSETVYQGVSLSEWVDKLYIWRPPPDKTDAAKIAVLAIGTNALPFLVGELDFKDSDFKRAMIRGFARMPASLQRQIPFRYRKDSQWRHEHLLYALTLLGALAKPAIPDLTGCLDHDDWDWMLFLFASVW